MPLTVQVDGATANGQPNTIMAKWFNDYHDLLTGIMTDQLVTLKTATRARAIGGPPAAVTLAVAAGTTLGIGTYQYHMTFVDSTGGESAQGAVASITTTSGNQAVNLSALPLGPTGTASRNIYRSAVGLSNALLLTTIADNTTTTYADTTADASLGTQTPPAHPFFGGLGIQDYTGTTRTILYTDGAASFYQLLSIGTNLSNSYAVSIDPTGILYLGGALTNSGMVSTRQSGASALGFTFRSWSGSAAVTAFSVGGQFNSALAWVDASGNYNGGTACGLPTNRNGTATSVPIYTGTTTPSSPPTGSIWAKA